MVKQPTSFPIVAFLFLLSHVYVTAATGDKTPTLMARIIVRISKRSSQRWDFTELNRNICPPSLCRSFDEASGREAPERPRGTGGTVFYQGDIVLDKKMNKYIYPTEKLRRRGKRATLKLRKRLWKKGEVIYRMSRNINPAAKSVIERAMKHISRRTCITFREKKSQDKDFLRFISEPGCWSQIGRVGGAQTVSLGRGCENLGTAVHEIVHALGVWHEQARPDRDKYVKVLEENISEKFKPDFEVVSKRVSTSRGYPYDYSSLMHYSKYAFTRNGEPTIQVIGIGAKLGLRIGQRKGLSTIDISQLRDMYKCNQKTDGDETVCHSGWVKHATTCYKFFPEPKRQFGPARASCNSLKAHLLTIESSREQRYITHYLNRKYPEVEKWRTAGRSVNNHIVWYLSDTSIKNITGYTNWARGHPGSFSSVILQRDHGTNTFQWAGEWLGSYGLKPAYEHAYICKKPARRKCVELKYADGRDYRGDLDHTRDSHTCQKWTENYPHNHTLTRASREGAAMENGEDTDGLGDHNKCRNPASLRRNRPWCYTSKKKHEWGYCDVSGCAKSLDQARQRKLTARKKRGRKIRKKPSPSRISEPQQTRTNQRRRGFYQTLNSQNKREPHHGSSLTSILTKNHPYQY